MRGSCVSLLICVSLLLAGAREAGGRQQVRAQSDAAAAQSPAPAAQTSQTVALDKRAEKIRRVVERVGVGNKITVVMKGGTKYHGSVREFGGGEFKIVEVDLQQIMTFRYGDLEKVRSNYGEKNMHGKRINPKTSVLIGVALIGGIFALVALSIPKT